jgi:zinc protease
VRRLVLVFAALSASIAASAAPKEKPPEGGPPKPFKAPAHETFALKNGMQVTLVPYGAVPKVTIQAVIRAGNYLEGANQVWLADLTGELMKEGAGSRTAAQVAEEAARMGGDITVTVAQERTTVGGDVLSEFGPRYVALVADVLERPRLPESELPRLKTGFARKLTLAKAQPQSLADERFHQLMFPDQAYGRMFPTEAMIESYKIEDVRNFYGKNFGAARARLYVAGRFDAAAMKKAIEDSFGGWARGSAPELTVARAASEKKAEIIDRPGAPQSTIMLGLPVASADSPDKIPLDVTNSILGGSFASRITTNIREQKGYTYAPVSSITNQYHEAFWRESADVTTAVTGASLKEIYFEIDRLRKEPPSAEELKGIQNYMAGIFVLQNSSRQGIIGLLAFIDMQGLPESYLADYVKNVYAVTPAAVQAMTEKYIAPSKMTLVVLGDKSKISEQMTPYLDGAAK